MRKIYIAPKAKKHELNLTRILSGSDPTFGGRTEFDSKAAYGSFDDDEFSGNDNYYTLESKRTKWGAW